MKWAKFEMFPQVEWDDSESEFQLAALAAESFVPSTHFVCAEDRCAPCSRRVNATTAAEMKASMAVA